MTLYEGKRDAFLVKVDDYKSKIETIDNEIAELETQLTARNSVVVISPTPNSEHDESVPNSTLANTDNRYNRSGQTEADEDEQYENNSVDIDSETDIIE